MGASVSSRDDDSEIIAEINITPLTDIFLVLLIIFMITSSAMIESGGRVNLPSAAQTEAEPTAITVTLTPAHEIYVNDRKVTEEELEGVVREQLLASADKLVVLRGDRAVPLGEAVKVMSVLKEAGAADIAIAAEEQVASR